MNRDWGIYQPRFALLRLLELPESTSVLIEKDDDLDFVDTEGGKTLASLKHKAVGDRLTDLSTDFWKSVRIWLARYNRDGRSEKLTFGSSCSRQAPFRETSFLSDFLPDHTSDKTVSLSKLADEALATTESKLIRPIATEFLRLNEAERDDFLTRILNI